LEAQERRLGGVGIAKDLPIGEGQGELYLPLASGLMVMSYLGRVLDRSRRAS
jgi:hypothetical protein